MIIKGNLRPTQRIIAWQLVKGGLLSSDELIHAVYGNKPDGGPLNANYIITLYIHYLRNWANIPIINEGNRGWYIPNIYLEHFHELLAREIEQYAHFNDRS